MYSCSLSLCIIATGNVITFSEKKIQTFEIMHIWMKRWTKTYSGGKAIDLETWEAAVYANIVTTRAYLQILKTTRAHV